MFAQKNRACAQKGRRTISCRRTVHSHESSRRKCEANGAKTFSEMFFFFIVSKYSKCSNAASLNFHQQQRRSEYNPSPLRGAINYSDGVEVDTAGGKHCSCEHQRSASHSMLTAPPAHHTKPDWTRQLRISVGRTSSAAQ